MSEMYAKSSSIEAPVAAKNPVKLEKHGDVRTDDYYWLKERENEEVISHLEAENSYREEVMSHLVKYQQKQLRNKGTIYRRNFWSRCNRQTEHSLVEAT